MRPIKAVSDLCVTLTATIGGNVKMFNGAVVEKVEGRMLRRIDTVKIVST